MPMIEKMTVATDIVAWMALGIAVVATIWFSVSNFCLSESKHPLDYYSNKLRTKPHFFTLAALCLIGIPIGTRFKSEGVDVGGTTFMQVLPELMMLAHLQGAMLMVNFGWNLSAAASLVGGLIYLLSSACIVLAITPFDPPDFMRREPGWFFSAVFLLVHIVTVLVIRHGANRHRNHDYGPALVPPGAEKLTVLWDQVTLTKTPILLLSSNTIFYILHELEMGRYGVACAVTYSIVAVGVLAGCCVTAREDMDAEISTADDFETA